MKNLTRLFTAFLLAFALLFTGGCNEQEDPTPDTGGSTDNTPTISDQAKTNGEGVKTSEDPQSEKVKGEQTVNSHTVESPSTVELSAEAQAQLALLTGGNSNSSQGNGKSTETGALFGWFIDEINGEDVIGTEAGDTYVYFFYDDGHYLEYNMVTDDWNWGFYYVNTNMTTIVFDADDPDQDIWSINTMTDETLDISKGNDNIVLNAYYLGDFDEEDYDAATFNTMVVDKDYVLAYAIYDDVDVVEDDTLWDIQDFGDGTKTFGAYEFHSDGTFSEIEREYTFANFAINTSTQSVTNTGDWVVDDEGWLTLTYADGTFLDFYISYIDEDELELDGYDSEDTYNDIFWWLMSETVFEEDLFGPVQ